MEQGVYIGFGLGMGYIEKRIAEEAGAEDPV